MYSDVKETAEGKTESLKKTEAGAENETEVSFCNANLLVLRNRCLKVKRYYFVISVRDLWERCIESIRKISLCFGDGYQNLL